MQGELFENLQKCADGSTFPAEVSVVRGEEEGETILLSIVRDVSRRLRYSNVHRVLHEVDQLILADQPVDHILRVICQHVVEIFGCELAWIGTRQESGLLEPEAAAGPAVAPFRDITIRWDDSGFGQGSSGEAARTGEPQYGTLTPEDQPRPWAAFMIEYNLRSYASLPLIAEGRVLGVFTMYSSEVEAFDSTMAQQLERFSQQVALSLVNARHQRQIKVQTLTPGAWSGGSLAAN
jgi:GAF domain-containing protein